MQAYMAKTKRLVSRTRVRNVDGALKKKRRKPVKRSGKGGDGKAEFGAGTILDRRWLRLL